MINIGGCQIISTMVAYMFVSTVPEGTSLAILLIPVSANVTTAIGSLILISWF